MLDERGARGEVAEDVVVVYYGHLARDGREHAINLLDVFIGSEANVHAVDAAWTSERSSVVERGH